MNRPDLRLQVGGTLNPRQHIYIERPEDALVLDLLRRGEYTNILSARQMGKSSLMARAMGLLRDCGVQTAMVDLSAEVGAPPAPEAFYLTLLTCISNGLDLDIDVETWWHARPGETVNQHILAFFRSVVLERIAGRVVIFLDEIDSTLRLSYTDDLFTTIRGIYNQRATAPAYQRLTFCLLGVATPNELIKDRRTTPYNIGTTIELRDFDAVRDDLAALTAHFAGDGKTAVQLLGRVLHWTGGQPFLTVRLCDDLSGGTSEADVDRLVDTTFTGLNQLSGEIQTHVQTILAFLDTRVASGLAVFELYKRVLRGRREPDQQTATHAALKLCGLVKRDNDGCLTVRNLIYRRLFDRRWVAARAPAVGAATYRTAALVAFVLLGVSALGGGGFYVLQVRPLQLARTELLAIGAKVAENGSGLQVVLPVGVTQADFARAINALARLPTVTELTAQSGSIVDLAPLRALTALQTLDLSQTQVADVAPLRALTALQSLNLSRTQVADVAPLRALTALQTLDLSQTQVADVAPLRALTALQSLNLSQTQVADVAPLRALTALETLDLSGTQVADVAPLRALTALQSLDLSQTQVADVAPLRALTALQTLNLSQTQVADVAPLRALTALQSLDLRETRVADIEPLSALIALRSLTLWATQVKNIEPLQGLQALVFLDLDQTQITNIEPLRALTALQSLYLSGTQVADVAPLRALTALESLYLSQTQVADVAPLRALTALQTLNLSQTQVADVAPLRALTALRTLSLSRTQVADVAPLRALTALQSLNLSETQVADVSVLSGLTALRFLSLSRTQVADVAPLRALTALQTLNLSETQVADVAPLRALTALETLDLSQTQVADVAPLRALTALQSLNLSRTQVADVSVLSGLTALRFLDLTGSRVPTGLADRLEWPFRRSEDAPRFERLPSADRP